RLMRERYGGATSLFQFGVDHETYFPRDTARDRDTVVFYGRAVTGRRADPLAWLYSGAAAGLVLSMTNYSLVPQEMLACGLPCVDLAGFSAETVFGDDGPVELAPFDAGALAGAIGHLLDDEANWQRRSSAGLAFVRDHTWDA